MDRTAATNSRSRLDRLDGGATSFPFDAPSSEAAASLLCQLTFRLLHLDIG